MRETITKALREQKLTLITVHIYFLLLFVCQLLIFLVDKSILTFQRNLKNYKKKYGLVMVTSIFIKNKPSFDFNDLLQASRNRFYQNFLKFPVRYPAKVLEPQKSSLLAFLINLSFVFFLNKPTRSL